MQTVLIHYASEIALKGKNRKDFENQLVRNIKKSLGDSLVKLRKPYGRIIIDVKSSKSSEVCYKIRNTFGISWFALSETCKNDINEIKKCVLKHKPIKKSFYIKTKRADKRFPLKSSDVSREVGRSFAEKYPNSEPNFKNADETFHIEITEKETFIFREKIRGLGGLPVGSTGKVLVLMSGGIDSPVAAYQIMKRGCNVDYLHFHALRSNQEVASSKIPRIIQKLKEYDPNSRLYILPHHNFDVAVQDVPSEFHLILFRRYMFKVAEKLAKGIGAKAIVSGDNLAQVASQTLENLSVVDKGVSMPIFRPLLTYDKQEIIDLAKKIETYNLTLEDYKDCCAIISKKPKTKAKLDKVKKFEDIIKQDQLIDQAVNDIKSLD